MRLRFLAAGGLLAAVVGCSGGPKYAPVSGVITLDGKPYGNAVVSFQPIGEGGDPNPGRGSSAYTDENGRFVLKCVDGRDGAVVAKHRVRIMTRGNEVFTADPSTGSDDAAPTNKAVDPIPPEWHSLSKK